MKPFDLGELLLLAALWGASYLFMRIGAPEFGPVALVAVRVGVASLLLVPLVMARGLAGELRAAWRPLLLVGLLNSALPFALFSFAALSITAGLSSILAATAPLWVALVARLWLGERLSRWRVLGMAIGFAGVVFLAWDKASFKAGGGGLAVLACVLAALCYGTAANCTKRFLSGVAPLTVATGSQIAATFLVLGPALWLWPAQLPSGKAWASVLALALLCTAVAYVLFFRLMSRVGPANTIAVTFLIPLFAVLWGWLLLNEAVTLGMLAGGVIVLLGTALAVGLIAPGRMKR